jgi:transcriptional regulator with XRE-family HTH domain
MRTLNFKLGGSMIIGERLRAIRESKNMSQGDIEKKTGLLRCYLSRCENGHTVPSVDTLEKWARAMDITMSQLFTEGSKPVPSLPTSKKLRGPKLSPLAATHLRIVEKAFAHMDPRYIEIVSSMARKFATQTAQ